MKIVIPTYRRVDRQLTLAALHPDVRKDAVLVCRPDEVEPLARRYGRECQVWAMPGNVHDLCATRQWVWENFAPMGRFVSADDDIRRFQARAPDGAYHDITGAEDQRRMLADLEALLDGPVGISAPRGRWNPPRKGRRIVRAGTLDGFYMLDGRKLHPLDLRWDRVPYGQDFDFCLQVLGHGLDTVVDQGYLFVTGVSGDGRGGQSEGIGWGEKVARANGSLAGLAKLWPDHINVANTPSGYRINRSRLLRDSRERLGMLQERCTACGAVVEERLADGACQRCRDVLDLVGGDPEVLRRLALWVRPAQPQAGQKRKRGRPPLGTQHPVLLKMRGKGPFRATEVHDLYGSRSSASVSLASLAKKGLLLRVGFGLYQTNDAELAKPVGEVPLFPGHTGSFQLVDGQKVHELATGGGDHEDP